MIRPSSPKDLVFSDVKILQKFERYDERITHTTAIENHSFAAASVTSSLIRIVPVGHSLAQATAHFVDG